MYVSMCMCCFSVTYWLCVCYIHVCKRAIVLTCSFGNEQGKYVDAEREREVRERANIVQIFILENQKREEIIFVVPWRAYLI